MDVVSANNLFQTCAVSKGYVCLGFFYNFDLPIICASVLLEYLLNLITLDYMLLIMVCIVYHEVFVGGAIVFDRVGQPSEFDV